MKRQIKIFLAGAFIIVPVALTLYVLYSIAASLDGMGTGLLQRFWPQGQLFPGAGAVAVIAAVYFVGLLTHVWVFKNAFLRLERLMARLPGVKVIYESVRDLMKLFGGDSKGMGRAVEYRPPGANYTMLGILTNDDPAGMSTGGVKRVAVYIPLAYMFGGPTIYPEAKDVRELDLPVEQALRLAATANIGSPVAPSVSVEGEKQKHRGGKVGCAVMLGVLALLVVGSLALQRMGMMASEQALRDGLAVTVNSGKAVESENLFIVTFAARNDTKWPVRAKITWSIRRDAGNSVDAAPIILEHIPPHQQTADYRVFRLDDLRGIGIKNPADANEYKIDYRIVSIEEAGQ